MKEKLPNSNWYVYLGEDKIRLCLEEETQKYDTVIFNFHELAMLWFWNDNQIKKYFSTRKLIENIVDFSYKRKT